MQNLQRIIKNEENKLMRQIDAVAVTEEHLALLKELLDNKKATPKK